MTKSKTVKALYYRLGANVDRWYADVITHAEFSAAQRAIWNEIDAAGLHDAVLSLWRGESIFQG